MVYGLTNISYDLIDIDYGLTDIDYALRDTNYGLTDIDCALRDMNYGLVDIYYDLADGGYVGRNAYFWCLNVFLTNLETYLHGKNRTKAQAGASWGRIREAY